MIQTIRTALLAITLLSVALSSSAQTASIFDQISDMDDVTSMYISKSMLSMFGSNINVGDVKISKIANSLNSIEIIEIDDETTIAKAKPLLKSIASIPGFEILTKIKEKNENVTIYGKTEHKKITVLTMVVEEPNEIVIINLTGDIPIDKISELTRK